MADRCGVCFKQIAGVNRTIITCVNCERVFHHLIAAGVHYIKLSVSRWFGTDRIRSRRIEANLYSKHISFEVAMEELKIKRTKKPNRTSVPPMKT